MSIVHVAEGGKGLGQLFVAVYGPVSVALGNEAEFTLLRFVTVTVCAALCVPAAIVPKFIDDGAVNRTCSNQMICTELGPGPAALAGSIWM